MVKFVDDCNLNSCLHFQKSSVTVSSFFDVKFKLLNFFRLDSILSVVFVNIFEFHKSVQQKFKIFLCCKKNL